jgi:hypothetical protein
VKDLGNITRRGCTAPRNARRGSKANLSASREGIFWGKARVTARFFAASFISQFAGFNYILVSYPCVADVSSNAYSTSVKAVRRT